MLVILMLMLMSVFRKVVKVVIVVMVFGGNGIGPMFLDCRWRGRGGGVSCLVLILGVG